MDDKTVELVHPDLPGEVFGAHPDAVAGWAECGWKPAGGAGTKRKPAAKDKE